MKLADFLLFFSLFAFAAADLSLNQRSCKTACLPFHKCPSVNERIKELHRSKSGIRDSFLQRILRDYQCPFKGNTPIICCPHSLPKNNDELLTDDLFEPDLQNFKQNNWEKKEKELLAVCGQQYKYLEFFGNKTDLDDFPWLALLKYETRSYNKLLCGGVLISDQYVLTAARCVTHPSHRLKSVRLGEFDTMTYEDCLDDGVDSQYCNPPAKDIEVERVIVHEKYGKAPAYRGSDSTFGEQSDLALVKLRRKVRFDGKIKPICLPQTAETDNQLYYVSGWSRSMETRHRPLTKKHVSQVRRVAPEVCSAHSSTNFSDGDHICAGKDENERACIADVGGPLMAYEKKTDQIARITVYGVAYGDLSCQVQGKPGVFTKIYKYMPWIKKHIFQ